VPLPQPRGRIAPLPPAPPQRNLPLLIQLVREHRQAFPERADEWNAYLHHLREYADAAGVLPESFEPLIADTFGELLALHQRELDQAGSSSTTKVEPPPVRASTQMRPPISPTSSRQM
jgi:hypothetical protein